MNVRFIARAAPAAVLGTARDHTAAPPALNLTDSARAEATVAASVARFGLCGLSAAAEPPLPAFTQQEPATWCGHSPSTDHTG